MSGAISHYTHSGSQDESSEEFIGEWMETRGIRDQIVLATKVRLSVSVNFEHQSAHLNQI